MAGRPHLRPPQDLRFHHRRRRPHVRRGRLHRLRRPAALKLQAGKILDEFVKNRFTDSNFRQDLGIVPGFGFGPESESDVVAASGVASMSEVIYGFEIGIVAVSSVLGIMSNALLG